MKKIINKYILIFILRFIFFIKGYSSITIIVKDKLSYDIDVPSGTLYVTNNVPTKIRIITYLEYFSFGLSTLIHELRHYHQVINQRLIFLDEKTALWDSVKYDTTTMPEYELPWEIDAIVYTERMMRSYHTYYAIFKILYNLLIIFSVMLGFYFFNSVRY